MLDLLERRRRNEIDDTLLFLEHESVVTVGRGTNPFPGSISVSRGGEATWHGPGQLVVYPIVRITDVLKFMRGLETSVIQALEAFTDLPRGTFLTRSGLTGVWTDGGKKVASLGIAVRHWVTYHGVAINVVNDLAPFRSISPCGLDPSVMTRLADLVSINPEWRPQLEAALTKVLSSEGSPTPGRAIPTAVALNQLPEFLSPTHRETRSQSQAP